MPYKKDVFDAALRRLEQRKLEAEEETQRVRVKNNKRGTSMYKIRRKISDTLIATVRYIPTVGKPE